MSTIDDLRTQVETAESGGDPVAAAIAYAELGLALADHAVRTDGDRPVWLTAGDEAVDLLHRARAGLPAGDGRATPVATRLGRLLTARFLAGALTDEDRDAAVAVLTDVTEEDSMPASERAVAHLSLGQVLMATLFPADLMRLFGGSAGGIPDPAFLASAMMLSQAEELPGRTERFDATLLHLRAAIDSGLLPEPVRRTTEAELVMVSLLQQLHGGGGLAGVLEMMSGLVATAPADLPGRGLLPVVEALTIGAHGSTLTDPVELNDAATNIQARVAELPAGDVLRPVLLDDVGALLTRAAELTGSADRLEEVHGIFTQAHTEAGPDHPLAELLRARTFGSGLARIGPMTTAADARRLYDDIAAAFDGDVAAGPADRQLLGLSELLVAISDGSQGRYADALGRVLDELPELAPADRTTALAVLGSALADRHQAYGVRADGARAEELLSAALASATEEGSRPGPHQTEMLRAVRGYNGTMVALRALATGGDPAAGPMLERAVTDLETAADRLPGTHMWRDNTLRLLGMARLARATHAGDTAAAMAALDLMADPEASDGPLDLVTPGISGALVGALAADDTTAVSRLLTRLRTLSGEPSLIAGRPSRLRYAAGLGGLILHDLTGDGDALDTAIADLEDARAALPAGSGAASAAELMRNLYRAYRHRAQHHRGGDPESLRAANDAGLAALVEDIGTVFLQNGAVDGLRSAVGVGDFAHGLALDCLTEENPEAAMTALELGRGLVVYAATATAGLPELLATAGLTQLAEEWRAAGTAEAPAPTGPDVPAALARALTPDIGEAVSALRLRTLEALARTPLGRTLFSACDAGTIASSLRTAGRDALIYLVAGDANRSGWALIVPARGGLRSVELPGLRFGDDGPLDAWLGGAVLGAGPPDPAAFEELCRWAGLCVVGPVLTRVPADAPRITVVPCGPLAAVPWHAALLYTSTGTGGRACDVATLSAAATGRQFTDLAGRPRLPLHTRPVFLQNPGLDLWYAELEAETIRTRWYPDAIWYGGIDEGLAGPGTPEEVLRHLPGGPEAASLLHVASHAETADPPLASYLKLARARRLDVGRMLAHARLRPPAAAGGLVVLGACRSTVAVSAYDESLTIGNAFVAAGAAGVIASLWPVPDRRTSLFMYVLHERLYRGDPADLALRGTQQWMLDPERLLPDGLPAALADVARSADLSDAAVWAAFTCQG